MRHCAYRMSNKSIKGCAICGITEFSTLVRSNWWYFMIITSGVGLIFHDISLIMWAKLQPIREDLTCDIISHQERIQKTNNQHSMGPIYKHGLTLIPAWISIHMPGKVWNEISYTFPNFNSCPVEVWEWIREREIKFIGLFENRRHRGPYSPYKPFNYNLYIGIIIFPHIDNPQSTGYN